MNKKETLTVVGTGKLGLALACYYASQGLMVFGLDSDPLVVEHLSKGLNPYPEEAHLGELLKENLDSGFFVPTIDYRSSIPESGVVLVVVPLSVDSSKNPDYSNVDSAAEAVGLNINPGTLVLIETTLPVGTTRERIKPIIETASGLDEGVDFYLAYSPERVLTGRVFEDLEKYPKLVGGLSRKSADRATEFYSQNISFVDRPDLEKPNGVWDLGNAESAEFAKLAETSFRDVNIGLANQFALSAQNLGIDIYPIIEACNSQSFSNIHKPGVWVGGHCIPVYPHLYMKTDSRLGVVDAARKFNESMPNSFLSQSLSKIISTESKEIAVLGVSYRPGVKESSNSAAFEVQRLFRDAPFNFRFYDPFFSDLELSSLGLAPYTLGTPADVVILLTEHQEFLLLSKHDFPGVGMVIDGRNALDNSNWQGCEIVTIGRGTREAS